MAPEERKMKSEIISISLSKALLDKVDTIQTERNFGSRSEVIRHCLQTYSKDLEQATDDTTTGMYIIGLSYYSTKTKPIDLQEIIKDFASDVVNTSRIAVPPSMTMQVFILRTNINHARIFFEKLSGVKGLVDKKLFSLKTTI
jgi:metal-responsive CopG/Arc/MetJ family transcriptional regulator